MGASAALSGLLFVAISINVKRIISYSDLPSRAGQTLMVLAAPLLIAAFILIPEQADAVLGSELLGLGAILTTALAAVNRPSIRPEGDRVLHWIITRIAISMLTAIPIVIAGISVFFGAGGGLYWIVPSIVVAFVGGLTNAWVLLVEILR
ncbi:MAG: hypothetical protein HOQ05_12290 [Corynebacteriales bacterium]|nr:hypothetical protein [Mycobacteriales bacterium]